MTVTQNTEYLIPQSDYGRKFAADMEKKFREQNVFQGRRDSTVYIHIYVSYHITMVENEDVTESN